VRRGCLLVTGGTTSCICRSLQAYLCLSTSRGRFLVAPVPVELDLYQRPSCSSRMRLGAVLRSYIVEGVLPEDRVLAGDVKDWQSMCPYSCTEFVFPGRVRANMSRE
jgi:hypothetical protein